MRSTDKPIRVLVVDDSAFMRKAIANMLGESSDFVVIDTARNGDEALAKVATLKPDVMTLDIDMPGMDGLTVLKRVMAAHPLPVVIVSSLTEDGAQVTIRALELGAVDFVSKHLGGSALKISAIRVLLHQKVRAAAKAIGKVGRPLSEVQHVSKPLTSIHMHTPQTSFSASPTNSLASPVHTFSRRACHEASGLSPLLALGCSTGGPQALQQVLTQLPSDFPGAVIVVQHMPKFFTKSFAERLNQLCALEVREAEEGDEVTPGTILLGPGGQHLTLERRGTKVMTHVSDQPVHLPYRPSVDLMMQSAAKIFEQKVLGVVMTGMGQDGLEGVRAIKVHGGTVLAQDEASSIVYGMPKAVGESGCADKVVSLSRMAHEIQSVMALKDSMSSREALLVRASI